MGNSGYTFGDFHKPENPRDAIVMNLRMQFLNAVQRLAPEVLRSLRESVLPAYFDALPELTTAENATMWSYVIARERPNQELARFIEAMNAWADRFHLNAIWILDAAYVTLHYHQTCLACKMGPTGEIELNEGRLEWFPMGALGEFLALDFRDNGHTLMPPPVPINYLRVDGEYFVSFGTFWDPFQEPWPIFETRARQFFELQLKAYKVRISEAARALGATRPPQKRKRHHFEWIVLYRCRGLTLKAILKQFPKANDTSTILHGINATEELIGLPAVRRKPGRRKESS